MKTMSQLLFAATPLLSAAIGFFTVPLLTWSMPPQVIAKFGLFQYASSAFLIIVTCGFDQAFLRELGGQREPSALLRKALLPCLVILGIFGSIALWWSRSIEAVNLFGLDASWIIPLIVVAVSFLTLQRFGVQQTRMDPNGGLAFFLAELALRSPLIVLLVIITIYPNQGLEQTPFIMVVFGAIFSSILIIGMNLKTWKGLFYKSNIDINSLQLFKFGMPLALSGILYWGLSNTSPYVIQALHGNEVTAKLVVAISIGNIATVGQSMFSLFWLPVVYKKMNSELLPKEIEKTASMVCAGAAVFFIAIVVALHILQNLLGSNYRDIAPLSTALCVLPLLYTISEVTFVGLMLVRKSGATLIATALALTVSLIANIILVPSYAAQGASAATCISAFAFLLFRTEMSCKYWKSIKRGGIYFGSLSIMLSGLVAPWMPGSWGPVNLLILIPYLWLEREIIVNLTALLKIKLLSLFGYEK